MFDVLSAVEWDLEPLLTLIILIPFWLYMRYRIEKKKAAPVSSIQFAAGSSWRKIMTLPAAALEALLLLALIVLLAGPNVKNKHSSITEEGLDVALALDISASMQAADFKPNRLEALKETAGDFIKRSGGHRIGLYAFAGAVFTQTPLTTDHNALLELLSGLSYEMINHSTGGGTAIGDALLYSANSLERNRIKGRDQVIILITDGESDRGYSPVDAARYVASRNIKLAIIGMAGLKPIKVYINGEPFITASDVHLETSLDDTQLKAIALSAGGSYYRAEDGSSLTEIFSLLGRLNSTPLEINQLVTKEYHTFWPAALALLSFSLLFILRAFVLRRPLL